MPSIGIKYSIDEVGFKAYNDIKNTDKENTMQTQTETNNTMTLNNKNVVTSNTIKVAQAERSTNVKEYISKILTIIKTDHELVGDKQEKFVTLVNKDLKAIGEQLGNENGKKASLKQLNSHTVRAMKLAREINSRDLRINYNGISVAKLDDLVSKFHDNSINACFDKDEIIYALNIKDLFSKYDSKKSYTKTVILGDK